MELPQVEMRSKGDGRYLRDVPETTFREILAIFLLDKAQKKNCKNLSRVDMALAQERDFAAGRLLP